MKFVRITVVEDNESLARGIAYRLEDAGHAVDVIGHGGDADTFLRTDCGDIVILDINLPGLDGLAVLRNLRSRGDTRPVILLTALSGITARVRGLDAGADDYLVKPFAMDELEARVRALSRRRAVPLRPLLEFGALSLDITARQAVANGEELRLPRREVALLEALMRAQGRVVSRQDLIEHTYGTGADVEESVIEAHLSRLRKRLRPHLLSIRVQRGIGYALATGKA